MQNVITSIIYVFLLLTPLKSMPMDIYKCEINGVTTFSDIKCAPNAKIINSSTKKKQEPYSDYPVTDESNGSTSIRSPHNSNSGSTIYTGPRGGRFYYNKNGNKTYIRHK